MFQKYTSAKFVEIATSVICKDKQPQTAEALFLIFRKKLYRISDN